jgi:hypothetical protein
LYEFSTEVLHEDAVVRSVSLNFATPADRVDIRASLAISKKGSFQHGGSIITVDQRKTACWYKIFWSYMVNTEEIHSRNLPSLPPPNMAGFVSRKVICTTGWRFSEVEEQTSPSWHATDSVYRWNFLKYCRIYPSRRTSNSGRNC